MSKMLFTFRWGKSIFVTDKDLKKILLQYYTKTEVDEILKQYAKIEDVAAELVEYAKLDDLNILDNHLTGMINDNTDLINGNTETLNEVVDALKNARLWNIVGMWDSGTSYKIGDVVGYTNNELYLSVVDDNLNHIPSDTPTNWIRITNVQSFNLDDYYDKTQINQLLNEYAKLDKDNTYAQGKRNIFRTLPEVYTQSTLPTKNTDLTTKKYVDDNFLQVSTQANIGKQYDGRLNINGLLSIRGGNDIELTDSSGGYKSIHKNGDNLQWGGQNILTEGRVNTLKTTLNINNSNGVYFNDNNGNNSLRIFSDSTRSGKTNLAAYGTDGTYDLYYLRKGGPSQDYDITNKRYVDSKISTKQNTINKVDRLNFNFTNNNTLNKVSSDGGKIRTYTWRVGNPGTDRWTGNVFLSDSGDYNYAPNFSLWQASDGNIVLTMTVYNHEYNNVNGYVNIFIF